MDVCARICKHYLTHDDIGDVSFEDGQPVFPDFDFQLGKTYTKARRIIIYSEFSSMAPLIQNVRMRPLDSLKLIDTLFIRFCRSFSCMECRV